jgi:hypothetical protein
VGARDGGWKGRLPASWWGRRQWSREPALMAVVAGVGGRMEEAAGDGSCRCCGVGIGCGRYPAGLLAPGLDG